MWVELKTQGAVCTDSLKKALIVGRWSPKSLMIVVEGEAREVTMGKTCKILKNILKIFFNYERNRTLQRVLNKTNLIVYILKNSFDLHY